MSVGSFRFVHAADLHLDTPFRGLSITAPDVAAELRDASLKAFDNIVRLAIERDASFVLFAGDIYDGVKHGVRAQLRFFAGIRELAKRNIQVFIVHGNHDPKEGSWSELGELPEAITIFGSDEVSSKQVIRGDHTLATIYGISFKTATVEDNLALRFTRNKNVGLHIGLLHCNVGGQPDHESYAPCSVDDLLRAQMDYWALGHVHQRTIIHDGDPWIIYPGNPQGRSPKPSEIGAKGAYLVECRDSSIVDLEFVATDTLRFISFEHDIEQNSDLPSLARSLREKGAEICRENKERGILLRCTLTGHGPLHSILTSPGTVEELLDELRAQLITDSVSWWESINNQTRSAIDREQIAKRGDFAAELLNMVDRLSNNPEERDTLVKKACFEIEKKRFRNLHDEGTQQVDSLELLLDAERLALELLEQDQTS